VLLLTACHFPGAVRPTLKIGLVAPFEGRYRYVGYDVIYAVRLALREANAAGGVGGYSVELVAYDDGGDPAMAFEQARKLAVDPQVVAAIGHFREATTAAALGGYAESGIPLVAPAVFDPSLTQGEATVYRLGPTGAGLAGALLERVEGGSVALVSDGGPLGAALAERASAIVSPSDANWLPTVLASSADALICDADPLRAGEVALALREAGWRGVFLGGPELAAADFSAVAGAAAEGAVFVTPYPFPADVLDAADFVAAYQALGPHVPPPGSLALPAYEATWVVLEALRQDIAAHGAPTRAGVAAALATVERDGLLGRIAFDSGHNWRAVPLHWYRVGADGVADLSAD
jgi:ABC-type branched-subunit amino acid transport system substrate-binding protein